MVADADIYEILIGQFNKERFYLKKSPDWPSKPPTHLCIIKREGIITTTSVIGRVYVDGELVNVRATGATAWRAAGQDYPITTQYCLADPHFFSQLEAHIAHLASL